MQRVDRLDLLTRVLRDRPGITVGELARELSVSVRSVFRDLEHLRERGYPIEADRGRGGGVRLHSSWGLGKVLLSSEEALCTLLSLAISEKLSFPMFSADVSRARKKIVEAFPTSERRRIAPLRERIFVGRPASATVRGSYLPPDPGVMRRLQVAFVRETVVRADYVKETGESSNRRVEPHAMLINWPVWYLLGFTCAASREHSGSTGFATWRSRATASSGRGREKSPTGCSASIAYRWTLSNGNIDVLSTFTSHAY